MNNDDFFRYDAVFSGNDEEIDSLVDGFHRVMEAAGCSAVMGLEMVNHCASHVVHLDVGFPFKAVEEEFHVAVVGVGDDIELGFGIVFVNAVERAEEPIATLDAFGITLVVDGGMHPNCVGQRVQHH